MQNTVLRLRTSTCHVTRQRLLFFVSGVALSALVLQKDTAEAQETNASTVLQPIVVQGTAATKGARVEQRGYVATQSASATKITTAIAETPQSVSVVTRGAMTDRAVQTVADSLLYSANVNGQRYGNDPRSDYFSIRGFGADLYLDGLRVPQIANQTGGYAGFRVEPYFLNRVEVLRGPSSALFGQTNVGGVVNMISKDPSETAGGEVYTRFGSYKQKEAGFDVTGPLGADSDLTYRLEGIIRDSETMNDFGKNDRFAISPTVRWSPDEDTSLTIYGAYMKDDAGQVPSLIPAVGSIYPNRLGLTIPRSFSDGDPSLAIYDKETAYIGYRLEHAFNDDLVLRQNFRYSYLDVNYQNLFGNGLSANQRTLSRLVYNAQPTLNAVALDTNLEYRFDSGPISHTLLGGIDVQWQNLVNRTGSRSGPTLDLFNPGYGISVQPAALTTHLDQTQRQVGFYLQDQMELGGLRLTVGGRQDYVSNDSDSTALASGLTTRYRQDDSAFTGRVGAAYVFDNGLVPYALYSTSFSPVLTLTPTPLKPTKGELKEVGVKFAPQGDDFSLTLSGFEATQQNVVNRVASVYYQTDEVRVRGIELEANATLWDSLNLTAAASWQDPVVTESQTPAQIGKMPYTVPKQQQSLFVSYDLPMPDSWNGKLTLGAGVRRIGKTAGDTANSFFVPGYTLVDAFARYEHDRYSFQLNGYNLGDKTYVAGCNTPTQCYYGQGLTVVGTVSVKW
ncbi:MULTISPECIES: TonB-dependent siderophore receptor [Agrobacterium]|uniref:TonB-dependent siderophore receptor n=1 Tax=Agrobacterium TaxID=357 RepID=UPI002789E4EB|nr:TonB-dependent siderophore receptor [Agrobacterium sp. SORGH_AS_0745]MDP9759677.1 iron complex outermembrane receptor protein [Agrobacterium tumefaciens]MDQ1223484.1 iron complex outermembrane receptor protein [Agrobacterium sp. SORGH_AS_0745]